MPTYYYINTIRVNNNFLYTTTCGIDLKKSPGVNTSTRFKKNEGKEKI